MKIASLALATALAAFVGCAQPAAAQTQDQTGAAAADQATPDNSGSATTGSGRSEERGYDDGRPMVMPTRPMLPRRQFMLRGGGAQFHFARGKARIDVTCSAQEDTQACVRAAGELIDKIAELEGAHRDNTTGSAGRDSDHPNAAAPTDDDQDAAGERM
jgi:hypothetical protein